MMRIEITLNKNQKISPSVIDACDAEVKRRITALFPDTVIYVRQSSYTKIEMVGVKVDEDRRRLNDLLQNVWEDDSRLH